LRVAGALSCATVAAVYAPGCYTSGGGTDPPSDRFYFPVGLAVSPGGHTLYAVNSDFDLQWSGGTLQSYNLDQIRQDAETLIEFNVKGSPLPTDAGALNAPSMPCTMTSTPSAGKTLGEDCAPAVDSKVYIGGSKSNMVVGAFATDLQLVPNIAPYGNGTLDRLFFPVRGTATLTYADVIHDTAGACPDPNVECRSFICGDHSSGCGEVGAIVTKDDTRRVTMPGEPFGMAFTPDWNAVAITHQTSNSTSLLTSGITAGQPTMQFVLNGVPIGGNGIAAVPHDLYADAFSVCHEDPQTLMTTHAQPTDCVNPSFLETNRTTPEVDLLRYYPDDYPSTQQRPYLVRERVYSLTSNSLGTDSRGIVIDPTPRFACDAKLGPNPQYSDLQACGQIPARVFFASRSPPSLVVGEVGALSSDGKYDPDALVITGNVPLDVGPARVYLAPIIDPQGFYEQRVFVVCFDAAEIFIYDPDDLATNGSHATPQGFIQTGAGTGPFAMAFDPMPPECVGIADPNSPAWAKANDAAWPWKKNACPTGGTTNPGPYRFGYVGNFTKSFVQLIDLDAQTPYAPFTFQQVVFTLGNPTLPKGQTPSKSTSIF
jgi:hypothetical protein